MSQATLESIVGFVPINEVLVTAGQPTEAQFASVASAGFNVVINLALHDDPRYSLKDQAATLRSLKLKYIHIPVQFASPTNANLTAFFEAMDQNQESKVLVHCAHNKRVPVFLALYRVAKQGWSNDKAFAEMRKVWQPDATWESFIAKAVAQNAS